MCDTYTTHSYIQYIQHNSNNTILGLLHTVMCLWYFVSHDMHVTPSLQVGALPSAVEAGLSKCPTLQKLTVRCSPPSVTAALLKAVTVIRSLEEVTLDECDFGM